MKSAMKRAVDAPESRGEIVGAAAGVVMAVSVIASVIIVSSFDGSAAADAIESAKSTTTAAPVSLAGRWSGERYGYGRRNGEGDCGGGCTLTYDIVACKEGWCGIAVTGDSTCGPIGVRLTVDTQSNVNTAFKGELVIVKGSAPYFVYAGYDAGEEARPMLHLAGDTGSELRIMRRSFPFEATLARTGDATCTLEKATS